MALDKEELNKINNIKEKSEDDYEKNIVCIAAGTLVLSLTFIEKIINLKDSNAVWFLISSWILLALTLLGNLVSHQLSGYFHDKCHNAYADCVEDDDLDTVDKQRIGYNKTITILNWSTTITLIFGIAFLVTFCSINAYTITHSTTKSNNMSKEIKPQVQESDFKKGRTISQPLKPVPAPTPAPNNNQSGQQNSKPSNK